MALREIKDQEIKHLLCGCNMSYDNGTSRTILLIFVWRMEKEDTQLTSYIIMSYSLHREAVSLWWSLTLLCNISYLVRWYESRVTTDMHVDPSPVDCHLSPHCGHHHHIYQHPPHSAVHRWNSTSHTTVLLNYGLTHWGREKMEAIFQTTFSNAFSSVEMCEFL